MIAEMTKSELANKIIAETGNLETAYVSVFNRKVLEDLKSTEFTGDVDDKAVKTAEDQLKTFLRETWAEKPSAHKYVIGSCLALIFLYEKPMHPQEKVQYITRAENGKEKYYCPYNEKGTVCDFCAADPIQELPVL